MIILRRNSLSAKDLFIVERIMFKVAEEPFTSYLDYSLLNKPKAEVYGFVAGIFKRMDISKLLGITTSGFLDFLIDIDQGYFDNPYHSFYHAADVAMVLCHMLENYGVYELLTGYDLASSFIAALCHDIGHPGKNNNFQINSNTEMSQEFKELSVIESHSTKVTLDLLNKHNLLKNIESQAKAFGLNMTQNEFKISIAKMILATDMTCHFHLLHNAIALSNIIENKKNRTCSTSCRREFDDINNVEKYSQLKPLFDTITNPMTYFYENKYFEPNRSKPSSTLLNTDERQMLCNILLHAADISNPCRPWDIFHTLSCRVCVEFFRQGEMEEYMGLPISPNMDYNCTNPSNINIGFIDFIVYPYFETLITLFPKFTQLLQTCIRNRDEWLKLTCEEIDIDLNIPLPIFPVGTAPTHVSLAAGTIQIPRSTDEYMVNKDGLCRAVSNWLAPNSITRSVYNYFRRNSEEINSNHMLSNPKSVVTINKRRKSDGFSSSVHSRQNFATFQH